MTTASHALGDPWHRLAVCDSTNDELARLAAAGAAHGTVVTAENQRAGRGRQGRAWAVGEGNLYGSVLLRPVLEMVAVPPLALVAGVACAVAIGELGVRALVKWPNDLVVGSRKLGGILCEASSKGGALDWVVVGIGINIAAVPLAVEDIATSLGREKATHAASADDLMVRICRALEPRLEAYCASGVAAIRDELLEHWRDRDRPARVAAVDKPRTGIARDIDDSGALVIELSSGELIPVVAGEVEIDYA